MVEQLGGVDNCRFGGAPRVVQACKLSPLNCQLTQTRLARNTHRLHVSHLDGVERPKYSQGGDEYIH